MNNGSRSRSYNLVFYAGEIELQKLLLRYGNRIMHYAYIIHDKDVYEEDLIDDDGNYVHRAGELEKPHIHVMLEFFNALTFSACKKLFTTEEDKPRVEVTKDRQGMFEYLRHKNDKNKYQYPLSDIKCDDLNYFMKSCSYGMRGDKDEVAVDIVNCLIRNVSPRVLMLRFGRDFIVNYNRYREMADLIIQYDFDHSRKEEDFDEVIKQCMEEEVQQLGLID